MNRIRYAMAPDDSTPKLNGVVECDETYVGGKPRYKGTSKRGRGTKKTPVFAAIERNGNIHRRVVADVTADTLQDAIREVADKEQSSSLTNISLTTELIQSTRAMRAYATARENTCAAKFTLTPSRVPSRWLSTASWASITTSPKSICIATFGSLIFLE